MTTMANLLTNRLYNNVTPGEALVYTLLFVCVYLLLLVAIMLTGFCFGKRVMSLMVLCVVIAVGGGIAFTGSSLKWMFPSANALVWMHFDQHMKKQIFPIWGSCLYFILLIVVLFILDVVMINHYDFAKVSDVED